MSSRIRKMTLYSVGMLWTMLGRDSANQKATRWSRIGLIFSGLFFILGGFWILAVSSRLPTVVPSLMISAGLGIILFSAKRNLTLYHANLLCLATHVSALLSLYFIATRFVTVIYSTDTIIGTYAGIFGVLNLQNPYIASIKPFLDQFGFSPSYYTPRVDGSFEFHLNYPAFNFLSLLPLYLLGIHDLRDGVLFFHLMSVLIVFGLVPSRLKAISLIPFIFELPLAVAYSWTDSIWAFFLLLGMASWYKDKRLGLAFVGLAGATKQIALVVLPFLLIRLWYETSQPRQRRLLEGLGALLAGFMVPNLPFIITSPSSWWKGTVGAYLPGNAPQVAGGIGLSEILMDLGISPPSGFFFALMGVVNIGTIIMYTRHFVKYRYVAWAMPAVILFFYYRSFLNYLVYWVIPLIPELARFNQRFLIKYRVDRIPTIPWHFLPGLSLSTIRSKLTSSALIVLITVAVLAGVSGAYMSRPSEPGIDTLVNHVVDADRIGAATALEVTLTNAGTENVSPSFFVKWSSLPYLWITNTSATLQPGKTERYVITATDAHAAIPSGTPFRVWVFNSVDGNLISQSELVRAELAPTTLANSHFRWWTLDPETGRSVPFGWQLSISSTNPSSGIQEFYGNQSAGIQMKLNNTNVDGRRETISLSQKIPIEASSFRIMALQPSDSGSRAAFGATFSDGTHTLNYIYSQTAASRAVSVYAENTTITLPAEPAGWTWMPIDASVEWTLQGWSKPKTLQFSLILKATSNGVFYASVGEISLF